MCPGALSMPVYAKVPAHKNIHVKSSKAFKKRSNAYYTSQKFVQLLFESLTMCPKIDRKSKDTVQGLHFKPLCQG